MTFSPNELACVLWLMEASECVIVVFFLACFHRKRSFSRTHSRLSLARADANIVRENLK